ncbi:MAG: hypothetical protein M3450_12320 [Actinomycetota bacterium]|nr:hypothetical protein [Actinomycetota bacterium]
MSLHHIGDEMALLRVLHDLLEPSGLIAIAELAEPMRVLPGLLDVGPPGLAERLDRVGTRWFASGGPRASTPYPQGARRAPDDEDDPRGVVLRSDVFVAASRQIVLARSAGRPGRGIRSAGLPHGRR